MYSFISVSSVQDVKSSFGSGNFNVAIGLQQMIPGHMFTIGASDDGQVQSAPRTGVPGPDLSQYPAKDLRRVYHGTYPSRVIDMLKNGVLGALTDGDKQRLDRCRPGKPYEPIHYVSKEKSTAAGYPSNGWTGGSDQLKLGESFTEDECPPMFCVLEGKYVLWDRNLRTNRLWASQGENKVDQQGNAYVANQQWGIRPESVTYQVIHFYV